MARVKSFSMCIKPILKAIKIIYVCFLIGVFLNYFGQALDKLRSEIKSTTVSFQYGDDNRGLISFPAVTGTERMQGVND